MEQYWVGKALYHAISCNRWNPDGRILRMNPPKRDIDLMFARFRKSLKKMQRERLLKKTGRLYLPNVERSHDSFFAIPLYGKRGYSFSLSDIVYAKWVMKNHGDIFLEMKDWNNLKYLIRILKRRKLQKPKLTAQLIFAVWLHGADFKPEMG